VAAMLIEACGSLDCHGTVGRNLRLYGNIGLRYGDSGVPTAGTVIDAGDARDTCLTTWLAGSANMSECAYAAGHYP
jgi:hypothetical protein